MLQTDIYSGIPMAQFRLYHCTVCSSNFFWDAGERRCPACGNEDKEHLRVVHQINNEEIDRLLTDDDWHGG